MYIIFYVVIFSMIFIFFLRLIFSIKYFKSISKYEKKIFDENKYTIVQPILSGDPRLEEDLRANLKNTATIKFLWLIDKTDKEAQRISKEILKEKKYQERVKILEIDDVPQEINPKTFKLNLALKYIESEYTIILDDDSIIDKRYLSELAYYEGKNAIITGIPYNYGNTNVYSKLLAAFVNSNSFLTYFTMAELKENKSINGMFYILKTEILKKYNAFEEIKYFLCDDLALASFMLEKNIEIIQSRIFCNVRTTIPNLKKYILQMKRWLLFSKIYMKKNFSFKFFIFIFLPTILPIIALFFAIILGVKYLFIAIFIFFLKSLLLYIYRYYILKIQEDFSSILYEFLNDFILPLIFIYTLLTPAVIIWRNKKIRVKDGKICYE